MEKGERVHVRAYPDETLERIFLEEHPTYILVCREEVYADACASGNEPEVVMGFPKEDITLVNG